MAHLDNLIESVKDPTLRAALRTEIDKVTKNRRLGLVFDRHLPESVTLPGFTIRQGEKVQVLADGSDDPTELDGTGIWTVIEIRPATAVLRDGSGETREVPVAQLVATREFGEPIYPGLVSTGRVVRAGGTEGDDGGKPFHTVINAENYHALEALLFAYEGQVDAIYIDPPYNTGSDSWIYNDRYVDENDGYRHSKWLSFVERRLLLARRLLKPTGVIIVAIGDDEHHRLRMLMDQVFGERNFIANIVWQGSGKNDAKFTAGGLDYMVVYGRDLQILIDSGARWREEKPGLREALEASRVAWVSSGHDSKEATKLYRAALRGMKSQLEPAVFRYDQIDEHGRVFQPDNLTSPNPRPNLMFEVLHPLTRRPVPTPRNGWRYSSETMASLLADDRILFGPDETTTPRFKRFLTDQEERVPYPTFTQPRMPGSKWVKDILGDDRFPNPKDHRVLARWLKAIAPSDALILDFFAGSGSTAEAVMRLNAEDGGTRRSLLVTNNEVSAAEAKRLRKAGHGPGDAEWDAVGVFEAVTRPRVSTVVSGIRPNGSRYSEGLDQNVEFFTLTYEDPALVALGRRFEAIAPLLWLRVGCIGARIDHMEEAGWSLPADAVYGVLFDTTAWGAFVSAAAKRENLRHAFIVTDSIVEYQQIVAKLDPALKTTRLYADYLRNFEINTRR